MTQILITLERGPDDQPTGQLTTGSGQIRPFTGWLNLIRILEDELHQSPQPPIAHPTSAAVPGTLSDPAPGTTRGTRSGRAAAE
jgi:hypothetical protein